MSIEFKNISKSYNDKNIIEDFNLKIEKGEFITIIGSSGSGKTTILKMINKLVLPEKGDILIDGKNIKDMDIIQLRRSIGYSIQSAILFPHMNVEKNICYVPNLLNKKDKRKTKLALHKWMDIVGLEEELLSRYPDQLSGGQAQRVGIARALAASPEILLMDEPFGALDEITRVSMQKEILKIYEKTKITIIFITHDISEALSLGTKVLVMDEGKIHQFDTPNEIIENPKSEFVKRLVGQREILKPIY